LKPGGRGRGGLRACVRRAEQAGERGRQVKGTEAGSFSEIEVTGQKAFFATRGLLSLVLCLFLTDGAGGGEYGGMPLWPRFSRNPGNAGLGGSLPVESEGCRRS
jgi:hypothetical protein